MGFHGSKNHYKEVLLNSLRENDTVEDREFNVRNIIDKREAIDIINIIKRL